MACHNERVARSRRHAEAKRNRAARKEKEKEKEKDKDRPEDSLNLNPPGSTHFVASPSMPVAVPLGSPISTPSATPNSFNSGRFPESTVLLSGNDELEPRLRDLSIDRNLYSNGQMERAPSPAQRSESLPLPASPTEGASAAKRPTEEDKARQPSPSIQSLHTTPSISSSPSSRGLNAGLGVGPVGLHVPTSKADRRRSINPAMTFNMDAQNSTFAIEPRLSPLPPSPLRTSFTDLAGNIVEQPMASPSPSSHSKSNQFPFNEITVPSVATHPATPRASSLDLQSQPPPRTSSLPDQLSNNGRTRTLSEGEKPESVGPLSENADEFTTPRIDAPNLPPMTFSLSDPDFAVILNNIHHSPRKSPSASDPAAARETESSPSSMPPSPSGVRSPQNLLASAAETLVSRSPSRTRLSPNDTTSPPQMLRLRQPSAESTMSVSSRFGADSALNSIVEMVASAKHSNEETVPVETALLAGVIREFEELNNMISGLKNKYTGARRSSQQYSEGLTVAGEEYDKEVALRREVEAEVIRLRAQVHGQTARLSVISGDERRQENMRRRSNDLATSLTGLERDISRLRAQRDMTLAEVEELNATRTTSFDGASGDAVTSLGQSLTQRLDTIKEQYREELEPLTAQREALQREITDLRESREQFLEESTALAAKNEELAELNAQLSRQAESIQDSLARQRAPTIFNKGRSHPSGSPSLSSLATSATLQEVPEETARVVKVTKPEPIEAAPARRFKWYKSSKGPEQSSVSASISKPLALPPDKNRNRPATEMGIREHNFQQHSTMRFTRCELCQDKMWGLQEVRCASCGIVCHSKCAEKLPRSCLGTKIGVGELDGPMPPSMFGRELSEQVVSDHTPVPGIVIKCIHAVEAVGMEYEGIYRKSGGSSQSKQITQLFERGDYEAFDLADVEAFNDISSVTSVLKTYFRSLPNPLLTHALHESFVAAANIRDVNNKHSALCALLKELPKEHYNTLRELMLHLNRVTALSSVNLMTSQNLGVVFGPTLMRSSDPNREFGDMAGKALSVQWMVDNAPVVFAEVQP
ncbi:Rho-type GTPase-activating protein 1/2, partial [Tremellales sp. Uapishka_1]